MCDQWKAWLQLVATCYKVPLGRELYLVFKQGVTRVEGEGGGGGGGKGPWLMPSP